MPLKHLAVTLALCACSLGAQAQTSRSQTFLVSQSEAHGQAARHFSDLRSRAIAKGTLIESGERYRRVKEISDRVIAAAHEYRPDSASWAWEVLYIDEGVQNAFCLPGGKITLYTGLINRLELSDDEVASVVGHEVAHALREHGREKRSNAQIANVAVGILSIAAGIAGYKHRVDPSVAMNTTRLAGGAAASLFFLLPNSREMEMEADAIGVELAARAGYDPEAATAIWRKMNSSSRVEFLSTHPSSDTRIAELSPAIVRAREAHGPRLLAAHLRRQYEPAPTVPNPEQVMSRPATSEALDVDCELPGGGVEAMAIFACQRLKGTIREKSQ